MSTETYGKNETFPRRYSEKLYSRLNFGHGPPMPAQKALFIQACLPQMCATEKREFSLAHYPEIRRRCRSLQDQRSVLISAGVPRSASQITSHVVREAT